MLLSLLFAAASDVVSTVDRRARVHELRARLALPAETRATGLRGRLLWVLSAFPEDVAILTFDLVMNLSGQPGQRWSYSKADGLISWQSDLRAILEREPVPGDGRAVLRSLLTGDDGLVRLANVPGLPEHLPYEDLIPWIVRDVMWIQREAPAARRVSKGTLIRDARGETVLDLDLADRLWGYARTRMRIAKEHREGVSTFQSLPFGAKEHTAAVVANNLKYDAACRAAYLAAKLDSFYEDHQRLWGHEVGSLLHTVAYREWITDDEMGGRDLLREVHLGRLIRAFPSILDWAHATRPDLMTMHYPEAAAKAAAWHRAIAKLTPPAAVAAPGTLVANLPGIGTLVELGPGDLAAESDAMKHCVGRVPDYAKGVRSGTKRIFSVRSLEGKPLFTIEAVRVPRSSYTDGGWVLTQWKGNRDRIPGLSVADTQKRPAVVGPPLVEWILEGQKRIKAADFPVVRSAHFVLSGMGLGETAANCWDLDVVSLADQGLISHE